MTTLHHGNTERARDGEAAMTAFVKVKEPRAGDLESVIGQSVQEYLVDLLADLRHWAARDGVDFDAADRMAETHFQCELDEEAEQSAQEGADAVSTFSFTQGPWHVDADLDQYGYYRIAEAATEQEDWVNAGFAVSDEEGERRQETSNQHETGNVALIESAPDMWEIVRLLAEREDSDDPLIQDAVALVTKIEGGAA